MLLNTLTFSPRLVELIWCVESNSSVWEARYNQLKDSDLEVLSVATGVPLGCENFQEEIFVYRWEELERVSRDTVEAWRMSDYLLPYEMRLLMHLKSLPLAAAGQEFSDLCWEDYSDHPITAKLKDFAGDRYKESFEKVIEILHFDMPVIALK